MRLVDLSRTLEEVESELVAVSIRYMNHEEGARQMADIFNVASRLLPGGLGWAGEEVTLSTHAGTHMDAPWHYGPRSGGECARPIDQVPLEWCYGAGVVLDLRHKKDGDEVAVSDLETALEGLDHDLGPGEIVLLLTGAGTHWGQKDYAEHGSGLGRESTLWLVRRGVRVIGTDAWTVDRPFGYMRRSYQQTRDIGKIWPAHFAGREQEYCQLEKLTNLTQLPPLGFTVICFPIKIACASAGWARVVALIP